MSAQIFTSNTGKKKNSAGRMADSDSDCPPWQFEWNVKPKFTVNHLDKIF